MTYKNPMVTELLTLSAKEKAKGLQKAARPGAEIDPGRLQSLLDRVRWDDLHFLHGVSQQPSIRRAARALGVSPNTIRSRINRLEKALGTSLFIRDGDGLRITAEGRAVLDVAKDMHGYSTALNFGAGNQALVREGEIRICASEGLGTFWLTPRLYELRAELPDLVVSLDSYSDQSRISPKLHDVSVGFSRPEDLDAIVTRIGFVHMIPFASKDYIRRRGNPSSLDDVDGHECIQQDADGMNYEALRFFLGSEKMAQLVSIRVGSSYSLFWAVASGIGIGALPTYIRSISSRVTPLDLPIRMKFEIWLSYNRMSRHSEPVRKTIEWLRRSFDERAYPWFAEEYLSPADFVQTRMDSQVIPLFDHLVDLPA
jgi:DNA-binding transcriptional LysR family regulator